MSGFYTKTPGGNIVHIRGNRKMSQKNLDIINKTFDLAVKQAQAEIEQRKAYAAALRLIADIDAGLTSSRVHYYSSDGRLLTTLDEVVRAAEAGELMTCPPRVEWLAAQ